MFFEETLYQKWENGKAPSLAIANPILVVTVMLLKPAKKRLIIKRTDNPSAPAMLTVVPSLLVNAFWKISMAEREFPPLSTSWSFAAYRRPRIYTNPVTAVAMQVQRIPLGAERAALVVSSDI